MSSESGCNGYKIGVCSSSTQSKSMEYNMLILRLVNLLIPNSECSSESMQRAQDVVVNLYLINAIIAVFVWMCAAYIIYRVLKEFELIVVTLINVLGGVVQTIIKGVLDMLQVIFGGFSQAITFLGNAFVELCSVLKETITATWNQMTRENISLLFALGIIIYVFPELCDVFRDLLRKQLVTHPPHLRTPQDHPR